MFDSFDTIRNVILIAEGVISSLSVREEWVIVVAINFVFCFLKTRFTGTCVQLLSAVTCLLLTSLTGSLCVEG